MIELAALIASCAPAVHPTTMQAIVQQESRANPLAIGVNGDYTLPRQPRSRDEAVTIAKRLLADGASVDLGLAQINSKNLAWLGLTAESVFDPCANLRAAQTVLAADYARAAQRYGPGQQALQVALSRYNTGNDRRGFDNGYVQKVVAQVPALEPAVIVVPVADGKRTSPPAPEGREAFGAGGRGAFGADNREAFGVGATTK